MVVCFSIFTEQTADNLKKKKKKVQDDNGKVGLVEGHDNSFSHLKA